VEVVEEAIDEGVELVLDTPIVGDAAKAVIDFGVDALNTGTMGLIDLRKKKPKKPDAPATGVDNQSEPGVRYTTGPVPFGIPFNAVTPDGDVELYMIVKHSTVLKWERKGRKRFSRISPGRKRRN
jgi:hypothetical protein